MSLRPDSIAVRLTWSATARCRQDPDETIAARPVSHVPIEDVAGTVGEPVRAGKVMDIGLGQGLNLRGLRAARQ
jgi:hypothetical protein